MAWNEPGGKDEDPWGKKKQEGPPELDELLKKMQEKLGKTFGGSKTPVANTGSSLFFSFVLLILGVLYVLSGIFIVDAQEQAVITRFGAYQETVGPGPHWIPRLIKNKQVVNVTNVTTTQHGGMMLTGDENIVNLSTAVHYHVSDPKEYLFNLVDPDTTLGQVTDSALRYVVGHSTLDQVLTTEQAVVAEKIKQQIEKNLNHYQVGLIVKAVVINQVKAPEEVEEAFNDAIRAREDEERFINQAKAYANKIVPIAEGNAQRILENAKAYKQKVVLLAEGETDRFAELLPQYRTAPQVTRDRLYLGTMEQVYSSTSKVFVNTKTGNNVMYLPLDKLRESTNNTAAPDNSAVDSADIVEQDWQKIVVMSKGADDHNRDQATDRSTRSERQSRYPAKGGS
jgi:membrane protease subunit HflK